MRTSRTWPTLTKTLEAALMVFLRNIGVLSCGVVLCLCLTDASQADPCAPNLLRCNEGQTEERQGIQTEERRSIQTIRGEVRRVEGNTLVVQRFNGQEVQLSVTSTLRNGSIFEPGDWIEAKLGEVNGEKRVLAIHEYQPL